ncbi:diffusible signal factor-reguated Ax21 faimly protein [Arenimonas sp. MALMAid1274]|uniref:diffusible signal factor-reguated Ax21 faimly protein n=1 Tax=Arenimonas sp. MALMAid1274 TaxID=3411630 RepID=UPI003B9DE560
MKRSLIALALASLLPLSAQADDKLSYTYVEADYVNVDSDADGFALRGSFEFGESNFYGFGSYSQVETDDFNIDIDTTDVGLGYAHGISDNADLIAEIAYVNTDVQGFGDADGYRASVGVRGSFTENLEGLLKANYFDGSDIDGDFTGTAGLHWKWTQTWGMTGEVEFADGGEAYTVGIRASF